MLRYKVKYFDLNAGDPELYAKKIEDDMNTMATNGWKVISVIPSTRYYGHIVTYEKLEAKSCGRTDNEYSFT